MKWIIAAILVLFFVIGVEVYMIRGLDDNKLVLGSSSATSIATDVTENKQEIFPTPTEEPAPTPTVTPTPIPTITPTPTITLTHTPTPVPQPQFSSQQINEFMDRFAGQYGVDPNVLRHIAQCESGFNALVVNGPYVGLYQFSAYTWSNNRGPMGEDPDPALRANAEEAVQTAAYLVSLGKFHLWPNCIP